MNPDAIDVDMQSIKLQLAPYEPDIIVADVGDSGDKVAKLIQMYGKERVYGCVYPSTPKSTGNVVPTWSEQGNKVSADKLMQNKRYITQMKEGEIGFYKRTDKELALYIEHWGNVVIRDEEDEKSPTGFRQTIGRKGDDHMRAVVVTKIHEPRNLGCTDYVKELQEMVVRIYANRETLTGNR